MLVERTDLPHFLLTQSEVEDIQVLTHTLHVRALGDGHDAPLREPAQCHLCGGLPVALTDGGEHSVPYHSVGTLAAERTPGHHPRAVFRKNRSDALLLDKGIALQLVHHRLDVHIVGEIEETACLEVAYADGAHLAIAAGFLHSPPRAEHVAVCLMDEQQVDVVGLQLAQALVDACPLLLTAFPTPSSLK